MNMWNRWKDVGGNFPEDFQNRMEIIWKIQKFGGLRILILHVLRESPKNGVEIMDAIQKHHEEKHQMHRGHRHHAYHGRRMKDHRSKRPSPGSIYPMLKKMVDEDLIRKQEDGRYELTETGKDTADKIFGRLQAMREKRRDLGKFAVEDALIEIDSYISYLEDIKNEKLAPHEEQIEILEKRLKKIKESLQEVNQ